MRYLMVRWEWPIGWYFEFERDWRHWALSIDLCFGVFTYRHEREYGVALHVGPFFADTGFARKLGEYVAPSTEAGPSSE
jgi:hypothetical protein